ncbi:MAG: hypothetical protein QOK16_1110 [Solirubrobacteraceae bacterium]|nr:hypothetical protein [Solirubrobacteraceae bacterium]
MSAGRTLATAASAAAIILAMAAPGQAATVATTPCVPYVSGIKNMPLAVSGFTPGSLVTIKSAPKGSMTPEYLASGTADPAGNFATTVYPPSFNPFSRNLQTFGLFATDNVNPALVAAAVYQQVKPGYTTNPSTGKPTRSAIHTVRGFPTGKNTYLHFRFQGATKRNVKLGKTKGACGIVSKRLPLLPTRSRPGTWTVYVDQAASYSRSTQPQLKYSFVITRTFG